MQRVRPPLRHQENNSHPEKNMKLLIDISQDFIRDKVFVIAHMDGQDEATTDEFRMAHFISQLITDGIKNADPGGLVKDHLDPEIHRRN